MHEETNEPQPVEAQEPQAEERAHGEQPSWWQAFTPGTIALALLVAASAAYGLAREVWDVDLFAARNAATKASCQNNLKQMGLVAKIFANQSQGNAFPLLSPDEGNFMMHWEEIYPDVLSDRQVLVCPGPAGDPPANTFTDQYYVYTGYLLTNQEDLDAFASAYTAEIAAGGDFSQNLPAETSYGDSILRLREGIERFLITDINNPGGSARAQSMIPIMWDWPDNHDTGHGSNVLYMDGHVEWVHFGEKFPITEEALTTFAALANYEAPTDWNANHIQSLYNAPAEYIASCGNNMKWMGLVTQMYRNEAQGEMLPPLSNEPGRLMATGDAIFPEYLTDPEILTCPGRAPSDPPFEFDDEHYVYLGYLMVEENDVVQFATAYNQVIAAGGDFSGDLNIPSSYGDTLFRLREGIERFVQVEITEPTQDNFTQKDIPVMLEWPENHENNSGGNVLFMDGHVEWMPYPGEFPMTETVINTLRTLAENTPATTWALPDSRPDPYGYLRSCKGNVNVWGLVAKMYSNEASGEYWPPLSLVPGELAMRDDEIYPEYAPSRYFCVCPGTTVDDDIDHFSDQHYAYLGYVTLEESDILQFVSAYNTEMAAGGDFTGNLPVETSYGDELWRLREGIERFTITDINNPASAAFSQSQVPVLIEWPGNHEGLSGGHVTYMDGHVEWHDYPGEFPMTEAVINALDSIAGWTPTTEWRVPRFPGPHDTYEHGLCALNERLFGIAFKIHSNESDGQHWPALAPEPGRLMTEDARFLRYYLRETRRMNCPGSPNAYRQPTPDDHSYAYLGYVVRDQEELERFAAAYQAQAAAGGDFEDNLPAGDATVFRLREGIERFFITDINNPPPVFAQRDIPVMIEWPDNHGNVRGGNVLYMDGRTEWLDYPSEFPMTEAAMAILTDLAGRGPIAPPAAPRESTRLDNLLGAAE